MLLNPIITERYNEKKVINEEKEKWIKKVLVALGADEDILNSLKKEDFIGYFSILEIEVWRNYDDTVNIIKKGKLVAQWKIPNIKLIKKNNKLYCEIKFNNWALPFQINNKK